MAVRRKSNWYIYFIAFGITMAFVIMAIITFRDYLFSEPTESAGINQTGTLAEDFKPTAEYDFNIMAMLSEYEADAPSLFVLAAYNAVESRVTFIPVPDGISMSSQDRSLRNIYAAQGGQGVVDVFKSITGVSCDGYVKLDRAAFCDLVTAIGNIEYDIPQTIMITDGREIDTLNAGEQLLSAERTFRYIMLADFDEGESYRFNIVGSVLSELINQNISSTDSFLLDTCVQIILSQGETDITNEAYSAKKAALLNTITYGSSPAEYYVPYGEYGDNGSFDIAANSVTTIKQKAGQDA